MVFDLESRFLRLLLVGQQREMELLGNKAVFKHRLGVKQCHLQHPDVVIVDVQQLLYHVVWPCGGSVGVLAESLKARLALCPATEKILVFDQYAD